MYDYWIAGLIGSVVSLFILVFYLLWEIGEMKRKNNRFQKNVYNEFARSSRVSSG